MMTWFQVLEEIDYYYFNGDTRKSTVFPFIIQHSLVCNNQYFLYSMFLVNIDDTNWNI